MSSILEVRFEEGQTFATATRLWKGDYGQILLIHGPALPPYYEVQFASTKADTPQIQVGTPEGVLIPNKFLQTDGYIYAWTFLHTGENDGETKYQIKIPVEDKGIPIDQETPEEKTAVQQAIETLNEHTRVATEAAASAEVSAKRAEEAAASVDKGMIIDVISDYLDNHPIIVDETDPTVPAWAKQPKKPTYTAAEVGALPDTYIPPNQTAEQVGADPAGTAASAVSQHNTDATSHNDLRIALKGLSDRINVVLDSDDTTLDQMSEVVAYIKSNKSMIDAITTSKVSVADIVDNLTTNVSNKPLSAAQGVALKELIDSLSNSMTAYRTAAAQDVIDSGKVDKVTGKGLSSNDYTDAAKAKVDALAPVAISGSYDDLINKPTIPTAYDDTEVRQRIGAIEAKESTWDAKSNFSGSYNDLTDKPTIPAPVTEQTVSGWGFTKNTGTYSKPTGGIPKADLANNVQASLGKADTALQEHQSLAAYRTAAEQNIIDNGKQDKITSTNKLAYSLISGTPTIPTVPTNVSAFTNDEGYLTLATLPKYEGVVE